MIFNTNLILLGIFILAVATYLIRYSGLYLSDRITFNASQKQTFTDSACVLLFSLAVINTLFSGTHFSGISKIIGILIAIIFAWRKHSIIVVILVAIGVTAALRYLGFS
nr:AzlD domain-containing protein [Acinetobacter sp. Marseille-Q1620]